MNKTLKVNFKNNIPSCYSYIRNRKIGVLGGSFNPAHAGHVHISSIAKKSLGLDEVWWLVSPQNRLKPSIGMEAFSKRLNYARILTNRFNYIKVLDLEEKNKLFASYKTVEFLKNKSRKAKFIWLMGSDILESFNKWLYQSFLTNQIHVAIIERPGYSNSLMNSKKIQHLGKQIKSSKGRIIFFRSKPVWVFIKRKLLAISSSEIRNLQTFKNMET